MTAGEPKASAAGRIAAVRGGLCTRPPAIGARTRCHRLAPAPDPLSLNAAASRPEAPTVTRAATSTAAHRPQPRDARRVERRRAPPVAAGGRAHAGDVGAGGADGGQVLRAQLAGQRDLEPGVVRLGDQLGERVGVEPREQPAAVLDRGVDQAAAHAGLPRRGDQLRRRQRPARHARGVGVGDGDDRRVAVDRLLRGAQDRDGVLRAGDAPEPELDVGRAASAPRPARRARRCPGGRAGRRSPR